MSRTLILSIAAFACAASLANAADEYRRAPFASSSLRPPAAAPDVVARILAQQLMQRLARARHREPPGGLRDRAPIS